MNIIPLLIEMLVVGAITAFVLVLLSMIVKPISIWNIVLLGFLTGAIVHFLMEIFGGNIAYCKYKLNLYN
jgi:hypothetical protein